MDCLEDFVAVCSLSRGYIQACVFLKGLFGMKVVRKVIWLHLRYWYLVPGHRHGYLLMALQSLGQLGGGLGFVVVLIHFECGVVLKSKYEKY